MSEQLIYLRDQIKQLSTRMRCLRDGSPYFLEFEEKITFPYENVAIKMISDFRTYGNKHMLTSKPVC